MPSINISEADFIAVANAARGAKNQGNHEAAKILDKIARKMNASLSNQRVLGIRALAGSPTGRGPNWKNMPSTIED